MRIGHIQISSSASEVRFPIHFGIAIKLGKLSIVYDSKDLRQLIPSRSDVRLRGIHQLQALQVKRGCLSIPANSSNWDSLKFGVVVD
jgi:hypothetical protein